MLLTKKMLILLVALWASVSNAALVLHYDFDESTGTVAHDTAGVADPAYDATMFNGTPAFSFDDYSVAGKYGTALDFRGGNVAEVYTSRMSATPENLPGGTSDSFTVSTWVKTGNWAQASVLFAYAYNDVEFSIGFGSSNVRVYCRGENDVLSQVESSVANLDDGWHHIAVAVAEDSETGDAIPIIYVDGVATSTTASTSWQPGARVSLGRRYHTSGMRYFTGALDDFAIFNNTLSEQQITGIYTSTTAIPEPLTVLLLTAGAGMAIRIRKNS